MTVSTALPFQEDYERAFQNVRGALAELMVSVGADPSNPQEVSRRFGLNKNLTWKASKIALATDSYAAIQHLPGAGGVEILLRAFAKAGASEQAVERVRRALDEFNRMVEVHSGDRATLELLLESLAAQRSSHEALEQSRKLAFRGNTGIWGVQAKVRLTTFFLAPSPEKPERVDSALLGGLIQLRRFRPNATWPLLQVQTMNDDGSPMPKARDMAIDAEYDGVAGPKLMPDFCSSPLPSIREVPIDRGVLYELEEGPVGNMGAVDCLLGSAYREVAPRYREDANEFGEFHTILNAPVENLVFDLIHHESLGVVGRPEAILYGRMMGGASEPHLRREQNLLPLAESVHDIGAGPPAVATPLIPRYGQMLEAVFDRMGWNGREFRGARLLLKYPPIPSTAVLRYRLPERP